MALDVPEPVAQYLAAEEAKDADALSRCFTEDGTVHDEGQDYHSRDSIRQWKQAADAKYRYVLRMVNLQTFEDFVTVRTRLTGEFAWEPCGTGSHLQTFQRQNCFAGDSIMTLAYPFPVSGDEFKGKRVLVTGGTKGMGQAMVRRFTLSGASVATTARSPMPESQAVALFVRTDIGTASGVQEVVNRIQQEWGGLDILVNNVGDQMLRAADIKPSLTTTGRRRSTSTCWHLFVSTVHSCPV
jgi:hypothetical protein